MIKLSFMSKININRLIILIIMSTLLTMFSSSLAGIEVGEKAPNFNLQDQHLKYHSLSDYKGEWVVIYFYPKDDTPGCTTQACGIRDAQKRIIKTKAVIFGISLDNVKSHQLFAKKYQLPFSILSDPDGRVSSSYNSLRDLLLFKIAKRNTFIIDPEGKIVKTYLDVDPKRHTQMILDDLISLQQ